MRIRPILLAASALFFTLAPIGVAQTATSPPAPAAAKPGTESSIPGAGFDASESTPPTIRVSAREVIIDVLVTDANGKPVHGLKASDFTIQENGKPQIIRSFYESAGATSSNAKPVQFHAGEYTNSNPLPAGGSPVVIFLLDALNGSLPFDPSGSITDNLRAMARGTQVGIFVLSRSGLHTVQQITTDRDLLVRALGTPIHEYGDPMSLSAQTGPVSDWVGCITTLRGFNQLAAYLSGIPGRRNLFWFTFTNYPPVMLMRDGGLSWGLDPRSEDMSLVHHTMDTYEMLAAAQVAVYPAFPANIPLGMRDLELEKIAEDFGAININERDPNAIAGAVAQTSAYYSLSYLPPKERLDGHYHHISVAVDKPGLKLTYREGYNSERTPTIEDPAPGPELMKASMEGNALPATQILFDAAIRPVPPPAPVAATGQAATDAKPKKTKAAKTPPPKTYPYQIVYGFPASQVAFLEDEYGKLHGAVEFDVVAYDVTRTRVALLTQTVNMPLSIEQFDQFAAGPFQFTQQIDLPPGQLWIHVGILDTVSNRVGTLEFPLMVGDKKPFRGFAGQQYPLPPENPLPCEMPCSHTTYQPQTGVSSGPTP
jgi:VWFA-related protein